MDYTDGAMGEFVIRTANDEVGQITPHRLDLYPEEVIELSTHFIASIHQGVQLQDVHCWRGHALLFQGLNDRALDDFEIALGLDEQSADAYHGRANVYRQQGKTSLAATDSQKALELRPVFPPILIDQADLHRDHGSLNDAVRIFTAVIERSRKGSQYTWFRDALFIFSVARCIEKDWLAAERDLELARMDRLRVASSFRDLFGSVAKFEVRYNLELPSLITTQLYVG